MHDTLQPGIEGSTVVTVSEDQTPRHLLPTVVLSTPLMIQFMESLCTETVAPHLEENETTVGTHVNVYHRSAARDGETVMFRCLLESVEGRQLRFAVTAHCGSRVVGEGTHERVVVHRARFAQSGKA